MTPADLSIDCGVPIEHMAKLTVRDQSEDFFSLKPAQTRPLNEFDAIHPAVRLLIVSICTPHKF